MREFADGLALVLSRLRAPRRAAARNQAPAPRVAALAKTEPVMAASGPSGTVVMPAVPDTPAAPPQVTVSADPAQTAPPPEPPRPRELPLAPIPILLVANEVTAPGDRRSSGIPVERPPPRIRGRPAMAMAMAAAVLAIGLAGTAWRLAAGEAGVARAPPDPDPPPLTASATSPPTAAGSVSAPLQVGSARAPPVDAGAPRRRARPPPVRTGAPSERPKLPFP
jgi:hypothetical protein